METPKTQDSLNIRGVPIENVKTYVYRDIFLQLLLIPSIIHRDEEQELDKLDCYLLRLARWYMSVTVVRNSMGQQQWVNNNVVVLIWAVAFNL